MLRLAMVLIFAGFVALTACKRNIPKDESDNFGGTIIEISDSILNIRVADTINLNRVKEGETVVKEFLIKNTGKEALVVKNIEVRCACLDFEYDNKPIKPHKSKKVTIIFDSEGYYGDFMLRTTKLWTSLSEEPFKLVILANIE